MTEPLIHDSTPQGSPILAYGESAGRDRRFWFFAGLLVVFLVLVIGSLLYGVARMRLPLPASRNVLAFVRSSTPLPPDSPKLWRDAQSAARPFPIFVGFMRTEDQGISPFAITPRVFHEASAHPAGIWQLMTEGTSPTIDLTRPGELVASWTDYVAPAWLRIWPAGLQGRLPWSVSSTSLGGPLQDHVWKTDAFFAVPPSSQQGASSPFHVGFNGLNIERLPEAWPLFQDIFARTDSTLDIDQLPELVEWQADQKSGALNLLLTYREPLTRDTQAHIAAAAGIVDRSLLSLSDGSFMTELGLPFEELGSSSSGEWILPENRSLILKEKTAFIGTTSSLMTEVEPPKICGDHILAGFNQLTLDQLASVFGASFPSPLAEVWWAEKNGKVIACW